MREALQNDTGVRVASVLGRVSSHRRRKLSVLLVGRAIVLLARGRIKCVDPFLRSSYQLRTYTTTASDSAVARTLPNELTRTTHLL